MNLVSGVTESFAFPSQVEEWRHFAAMHPNTITAISLRVRDDHIAIPIPRAGFDGLALHAEPVYSRGVLVAFRLILRADDINVIVVVFAGEQRMTKVMIERRGE